MSKINRNELGWIKIKQDAMATYEDWETVCDTAGCDPEGVEWVKLYVVAVDVKLEGEDEIEEINMED